MSTVAIIRHTSLNVRRHSGDKRSSGATNAADSSIHATTNFTTDSRVTYLRYARNTRVRHSPS